MLKAPGNDWNLDLSIPSVRIWKKNTDEFMCYNIVMQDDASIFTVASVISNEDMLLNDSQRHFLKNIIATVGQLDINQLEEIVV